MEKFLGSCNVTDMLAKIRKLDKSEFSGKTILLQLCGEANKKRYVNVGANIIYFFITNDHILEYISNMGDNMIHYSIATGEEMKKLSIYTLQRYKKSKN